MIFFLGLLTHWTQTGKKAGVAAATLDHNRKVYLYMEPTQRILNQATDGGVGGWGGENDTLTPD